VTEVVAERCRLGAILVIKLFELAKLVVEHRMGRLSRQMVVYEGGCWVLMKTMETMETGGLK
jgi:hypothetical protein